MQSVQNETAVTTAILTISFITGIFSKTRAALMPGLAHWFVNNFARRNLFFDEGSERQGLCFNRDWASVGKIIPRLAKFVVR